MAKDDNNYFNYENLDNFIENSEPNRVIEELRIQLTKDGLGSQRKARYHLEIAKALPEALGKESANEVERNEVNENFARAIQLCDEHDRADYNYKSAKALHKFGPPSVASDYIKAAILIDSKKPNYYLLKGKIEISQNQDALNTLIDGCL